MRNTWLEKYDEKSLVWSNERYTQVLVEGSVAIRLFKLHDDGAVTTWFCGEKDYCASKNKLGVLIDKPTRVDGYTMYLNGEEWSHSEFEEPIITTMNYEILVIELPLNLLDII